MKKTAFLIFVIICLAHSAFLQSEEMPEQPDNIVEERNFTISFFTTYPIFEIGIEGIKNGEPYGNEISYASNPPLTTGLSFEYKGLGISVLKSFENIKDEKKYGKTKSIEEQLFYYSRHWGIDIYHQNYEGLYLKSAASALDSEKIRPDIKVDNIGFSGYYSLFDKFSLASAFANEPVSESSGSPLVYLSANSFKISAGYSLVPQSIKYIYYNFPEYTGGRYSNISTGGGVAGVYKFKKNKSLFVSGAVLLGLGYMSIEDSTKNGSTSFSAAIKASAGYNNGIFHAILKFTFYYNSTLETGNKTDFNAYCVPTMFEFTSGYSF